MMEVLVVDDEELVRKSLAQTLEIEGADVVTAANGREALAHIHTGWAGVVVTDINMPVMDGMALLREIRLIDADLPVIMLTGHGDVSIAVDAMRQGAYDFLEKPFSTDVLLETVQRAQEKRLLTLENRRLRQEVEVQSRPGPRIIGNHPDIRKLRDTLNHVKDTPADVLINGETGCGKELVARYLHTHSKRSSKAFVAINCGAIPENLIESELFGHEAGAFTGAGKKRVGKFQYANGGTLFLDEIESMPMVLQIKMLRVLEERKVEPLGSNQQIPLDIRIIAATKVDLKELSDKGEFRLDLYYRLNVVQVHIPPLRDRREDVPILFEHFVWAAANRYGGSEVPALTSAMRQQLMAHDWPGNVRELRNLAECFVLLGPERAFDSALRTEAGSGGRISLAEQVSRYEEMLIREVLTRHQGRLKDAQEEMGLGRKTLYEKMKKYGLDKQTFKGLSADDVASLQ
ncbi:sigma-54-dependent transcriptional regulator [Parathalassolituus penaei]|uniref:Sigma-54 dependent transcriptional regulator n=1 Tax=Parathalassolituus penaei TaxID=2997323 RepID=A0A9X3IUB8_9GAMM|nr:sigma-54 dependent transcriptional regulator [Parathalassolituus penaei]MCY0966804.1 sigma-54 dependent transcriptional regulator [Parathalassolituus penaei]